MATYENYLKKSFGAKIILFPHEYIIKMDNPVFPIREVFIGILNACALFPQEDEEHQFMGYIAQHFYNIIKLLEISYTIKNTDEDTKLFIRELSSFPVMFFGSSHMFYESLLRWKKFSKSGKGSLYERFHQGLMCGRIFGLIYEENITIAEATKKIIDIFKKNIKKNNSINPFPSLTVNNICTNYWPRFKGVAWLWFAFSLLMPSYEDEQKINTINTEFYTIQGKSSLSGFDGWHEIFKYSMYALTIMKEKNAIDDNIWVYMGNFSKIHINHVFPEENILELNNIFAKAPNNTEKLKHVVTLKFE